MLSSFLAGLANPPDEEMGKKDDDHKVGSPNQSLVGFKGLLRIRRKRAVLFLVAVGLIWFLFTHRLRDILPGSFAFNEDYIQANPHGGDIETVEAGGSFAYGPDSLHGGMLEPLNQGGKSGPSGHQPFRGQKPDRVKDATNFYYEGLMKFYALPSTLHAASKMGGYRQNNRNVLFAAANLKSVSILLPYACSMAKQTTNNVHMAFMGRNGLSVGEILRVNGLNPRICRVHFHDARPDFAPYSSGLRAESSVTMALKYIHQYLHPQAIIMGADDTEDSFFTRTMVDKTKGYSIPMIQLPGPNESVDRRAIDDLMWLSRLDSRSLANWHQPNIEIVIQAQTGSSGSLIRLLQSLSKADYVGTVPPRLVVEIPPEIDRVFERFLNEFQWPPGSSGENNVGVTLRRRIPIQSRNPEEAAIRFMESFYPSHLQHSHVLILSSTMEVTPLYFQALRYYLLSYRYSLNANTFPPVIGIALDLPTLHLNGTTPFEPPSLFNMALEDQTDLRPVSNNVRPPFLWEAPSTNAALYFGSSWVELHSFLSLRLAKHHSDKNPQSRKKLIGTHMPSWSEHVLEFMRTRGYSFYYPGSINPMEAHASVREESSLTPDEYQYKHSEHSTKINRNPSEPSIFVEPFLPPPPAPTILPHSQTSLHPGYTSPMTFQPLLKILPFLGPDPNLLHLPHLTYKGELIPYTAIPQRLLEDAELFRNEVGGCQDVTVPKGKRRLVKQGSAEDLFCWGDGRERWEDIPDYRKEGGDSTGLRSARFKAPGDVGDA